MTAALLRPAVVGASADQALTPPVFAVPRSKVIAAQRMAFVAMRLPLVGEAPLAGCVQKILALGADEQVIGTNAEPVVAGVANDPALWNRPVVQVPRKAVRGYVAPLPEKAPVAVVGGAWKPLPTSIRFLHSSPKVCGVIHTDQSNATARLNQQLRDSWSTPKRTGT